MRLENPTHWKYIRIKKTARPKGHSWNPLIHNLYVSFCSDGKSVHPRRLLGEPLDQTVTPTASCFCVTADNRFIIACGYWDKSFKIFSTDTGWYNLERIVLIYLKNDMFTGTSKCRRNKYKAINTSRIQFLRLRCYGNVTLCKR